MQVGILIEAILRDLTAKAIPYYILQTGNHSSGLILVKLNSLDGSCKLLTQQRNFMTDMLEWTPALQAELVLEVDADAYIARSKTRDPDLWVIEVEDRAMNNPFAEL